MNLLSYAQRPFVQHFPASGWVEHDPEDIWNSTLSSIREALTTAKLPPQNIAAVAITNQRETCIIWDRRSGKPIHRAIVWQDRRTTDICQRLVADGCESLITGRTGLLIDPYFSATKILWLLENIEGARTAAEAGHLAVGTIDTFLIWKLTDGKVHATDATNASRTMLYNIHEGQFDDDLLKLFRIPRPLLPEIRDSNGYFGETDPALFGHRIAIRGCAGDQQAATIGQACFQPGMIKATYGTGGFVLLNTGSKAIVSQNRLLTTVAFQLSGRRTYALEGAIFIAGAAVQWLRDNLKLIESSSHSSELAENADLKQDIVLVPAFVGLGAPYWVPEARGAIFGLTRSTGPAELARAALEAVCFQTRDLLDTIRNDIGSMIETTMRVDGGMAASDWTMQKLADTLGSPVERPSLTETSALGAAWLAGHAAGCWPPMEEFSKSWRLDTRFQPSVASDEREHRYRNWKRALDTVLHFTANGMSPNSNPR